MDHELEILWGRGLLVQKMVDSGFALGYNYTIDSNLDDLDENYF